jgi:penicillin G amidase
MERTRRIFSGTLAELFGAEALPIDKFSRSIGYKRLAEESLTVMDKDDIRLLESYSAGINDFVDNIRLASDGSAKLFPPEFYAFGLSDNWSPWTAADCVANIKLIGFSLTWDWAQDF